MVKVKAVPTGAVSGETDAIVGMGFVIVNVSEPLVPPPGAGFVSHTETGPAVDSALAGTVAIYHALLPERATGRVNAPK